MVDAAAVAVAINIDLALIGVAYKLRGLRQDTFERWDGPLDLANAAADDAALTALERLAVDVASSGIIGGLEPLTDPERFREPASLFLKELARRDQLPRLFARLLHVATALSLCALAAVVAALPTSYAFLMAWQGTTRHVIFGLAGATALALGVTFLAFNLLTTRLAVASGRAGS